MEEQKPKLGIGVMIFREGNVLMARRKGAHMAMNFTLFSSGADVCNVPDVF